MVCLWKYQYPYAHFATQAITADMLFPIAWEAIQYTFYVVPRVCVVVCVDHQSNNLMFTHSICDGVWHVTMNMFHTHTREREREYRTHAEPVEGGVGGQTVGETLCSRVEDPVLPER